jgi:3-phenylpropionate/trans-cinnamate dioxygenase ferredoxin reductase subunit
LRQPEDLLLIGAGLASATLVSALRRRGYDGSILMIGREQDLPYERPPLSKEVLLGEMLPEKTEIHPAQFYTDRRIDVSLGSAVESVAADGSVRLASGATAVGRNVVITVGLQPRCLPGICRDDDAIFQPNSRPGAIALRDRLHQGSGGTLIVVGAGLIGCEVAVAAACLGWEVQLVDVATQPLERAVGSAVGAQIAALLTSSGVNWLPSHTLVDWTRSAGRVEITFETPAGPTRLSGQGVVLAVGSEPSALEVPSIISAPGRSGIAVGSEGRTVLDHIFAAGDIAWHHDAWRHDTWHHHGQPAGGHRVEHYDSAIHQAEAVAAAIVGEPIPEAPPHWFWSELGGRGPRRSLQGLGEMDPKAELIWRPGRDFLAIAIKHQMVVGAVGLNRAREISQLSPLIRTGVQLTPDLLAGLTDPACRLTDLVGQVVG